MASLFEHQSYMSRFQLLLLLSYCTCALLAWGCGPKPTLVGEEYSASSNLPSYSRIAVITGEKPIMRYWRSLYQSVSEHIELLLSEKIQEAKVTSDPRISESAGVVVGGSALHPEDLEDSTLSRLGKEFGVEAVFLWNLIKYSEQDKFSGTNYRLTVWGIDCQSGKQIAYGSGRALFSGTGFRSTLRSLTKKVISNIMFEATEERPTPGISQRDY